MNNLEKPQFMHKTLEELKIGSYDKIYTITEYTTIINALRLFVKHRVSALPVVADSGDYIAAINTH